MWPRTIKLGTFNSFITKFLFDGKGVGTYYTESGDSFNSKDVEARDSEIEKLGLGGIFGPRARGATPGATWR